MFGFGNGPINIMGHMVLTFTLPLTYDIDLDPKKGHGDTQTPCQISRLQIKRFKRESGKYIHKMEKKKNTTSTNLM